MLYIAIWYFLSSCVTFTAYGLDKRKAKLGNWRIKENTLHLFELLGGWPGALVAQRYFHHKTRKTSFQIVYWLIVSLHIAVWTYVIYRRLRFQ